MDPARYAEVLRRLAATHVEFIVVGMMAGVLAIIEPVPGGTPPIARG
jgi:hypothetical protein